MADGLLINKLKMPVTAVDITAVTVGIVSTAIYPASNFPVLGGHYFSRVGKKLRIRLFGRATSDATAGRAWKISVFFGTGADGNGVNLAQSAVFTRVASITNVSWMMDIYVHCRSTGSAGTLFCTGKADFNNTLVASTSFPILIPDGFPVVSPACDLTAALILSVQVTNSGSLPADTMQVHDMEVTSLN